MKNIFYDLIVITCSVLSVFLLKWIFIRLFSILFKNRFNKFISQISDIAPPLQLLILLLTLCIAMDITQINFPGEKYVYHFIKLVFIAGIAWLSARILRLILKKLRKKYNIDVQDNLAARKSVTHLEWVYQLSVVAICVFAVAAMLFTFPGIRSIGVTFFASAGIAGLVIGIAAQPLLSNLIAGIQIAITQPIRLDDVVIVEGEWGRIEEIGNTYVVVKIWDHRRLVLPISYFVQKPFQNWTRNTADIIGTVFLYVDYRFPVDELRAELDKILTQTDLWDGNVKLIQVTESTEKSMQLRVLVTASDSPSAWDLRCFVREKLVYFIQENYPEYLPVTRATINSSDPDDE